MTEEEKIVIVRVAGRQSGYVSCNETFERGFRAARANAARDVAKHLGIEVPVDMLRDHQDA